MTAGSAGGDTGLAATAIAKSNLSPAFIAIFACISGVQRWRSSTHFSNLYCQTAACQLYAYHRLKNPTCLPSGEQASLEPILQLQVLRLI